jgi:hypothetical protein
LMRSTIRQLPTEVVASPTLVVERHAAANQLPPPRRLNKGILRSRTLGEASEAAQSLARLLRSFVVTFYVYTFNQKPEEKW